MPNDQWVLYNSEKVVVATSSNGIKWITTSGASLDPKEVYSVYIPEGYLPVI